MTRKRSRKVSLWRNEKIFILVFKVNKDMHVIAGVRVAR